MGQGIGAAIQLKFKMDRHRFENDRKYFSQDFFEFYERKENGSKYVFAIKPELFLPHYGDFLAEFYDIIGEDFQNSTGIKPDSKLLKINDIDRFVSSFDFDKRDGRVPMAWDATSILSCQTESAWQFYSGSYKAYLEVYETFTHFERILARFMKNPLGSIVKFAECG